MKKIVAALVLGITATASMAQYYHRHPGYYGGQWRHGHSSDWILPAIIGGVIVYGATRPAPVVVQQPTVVLPVPPMGYRWESIVDAQCNCTRFVLVPS